jgi:Tfp pilus assembly major pilin PilA
MNYIVIFAFVTVIGIMQYANYLEKQQLLETIQDMGKQIKAKDLQEYKTMTEDTPTFEPVAHTEESLYYREIEETKV